MRKIIKLDKNLRKKEFHAATKYYDFKYKKSKSFTPGDRIPYGGRVFDKNEIINLIVTGPEGNSTTFRATVSSEGTYSYSFRPSIKGQWMVNALFEGNELHMSSSSGSTSFQVTESPQGILEIILSNWIIIIVGAVVAITIILVISIRRSEEEF